MVITAVKRALTLAGRIDQKYNINKIFIQKYAPPHYRKTLNKIVDIAGTLAGGYGLYNAINALIAEDSPGIGAQIPFRKKQFTTGKSYKTRSGYTRRRSQRYCIRPKSRYYK